MRLRIAHLRCQLRGITPRQERSRELLRHRPSSLSTSHGSSLDSQDCQTQWPRSPYCQRSHCRTPKYDHRKQPEEETTRQHQALKRHGNIQRKATCHEFACPWSEHSHTGLSPTPNAPPSTTYILQIATARKLNRVARRG